MHRQPEAAISLLHDAKQELEAVDAAQVRVSEAQENVAPLEAGVARVDRHAVEDGVAPGIRDREPDEYVAVSFYLGARAEDQADEVERHQDQDQRLVER